MQISPSRSITASRTLEGDTKPPDVNSLSSITLDLSFEKIVVNRTVSELSMSRSDVRKSKSKVRSYFKKCKDALYGHTNGETSTLTENEDLSHSSHTLWYLATESNVLTDLLNEQPMKIKELEEQEKFDKEIRCTIMTENPQADLQINKVTFYERH